MFEMLREKPLVQRTAVIAATGLAALGLYGCKSESCSRTGKVTVCHVNNELGGDALGAVTVPVVAEVNVYPENTPWAAQPLEIPGVHDGVTYGFQNQTSFFPQQSP